MVRSSALPWAPWGQRERHGDAGFESPPADPINSVVPGPWARSAPPRSRGAGLAVRPAPAPFYYACGMTSADDLRQAVHQAKHHPAPEQIYTQLQAARAETGAAAGQCPGCGTFRSDGGPPILHQPGCTHEDGWREDPLSYL